jgi:ornithine cyclodeaminase/alanine dehydrogenase-like protein (mu-crystallin family)
LVSLATVANVPHIHEMGAIGSGSTLLHVSLRDLSPQLIAQLDNVVDDVDHVLRANTSLHLAEQKLGHRRFVRCTLADVMSGQERPRDKALPIVFSPFGLGFLDLAVARLVLTAGAAMGLGVRVESFLTDTAN